MPVTDVIIAKIEIPANASEGTILPVKFIDPTTGAETEQLSVPVSETWIITDIFIKDTSEVPIDAVVELRKGTRSLGRLPPLSTLLVSNPSRPEPPAFGYEGGSTISALARTLAAETTGSAQTVKFYLKVQKLGV